MSNSISGRIFRPIGLGAILLLLLVLALLALSCIRVTATILILVSALAAFLPSLRKGKYIGIFVLLLVASFLSPYDLSLRNLPGPPRFVPLVMGTLSQVGRERAQRGEIVSGGCIYSGLEPAYVLAW